MTVGNRVDLWLERSALRNQAKVEEDNRDSTAMLRRSMPWMIAMNVGLVATTLLLQQWLLAILAAILIAFHVGLRSIVKGRPHLGRSGSDASHSSPVRTHLG
jgi:hypothetical protein